MTGSVPLISESPEDPFSMGRAASVVLDEQGLVTGWSERARALLGYTPDEVYGRSAAELLVDPQDRGLVREATAVCRRDNGWFGFLPVRDRHGVRQHFGLRVRRLTRSTGADEWFLVGAPAQEVAQWELDRRVMDGLFRQSPIGLTIHDPSLVILRINRAIAGIGGITPDQARGHRIGDFLVREDAETIEARLRQVLETGAPMIFTEQPGRLRGEAGERFVSASAFRLDDASGGTMGVALLVEDVTDRHRARRRLAMLNRASKKIGTTLDVETTAQELVDAAVPGLADCVTVDLLQAVDLGEEPLPGGEGLLVRSALKSTAPYPERVMYPVGTLRTFPPDAPQARSLLTRRPVLVAEFDPEAPASGLDPEQAAHARKLGAHSLMVVPLTARGLVLGLVCLWRYAVAEPFEEDDLTLAGEFAALAAVSIDNARRYTQQHRTALALQRRLLPGEFPLHPAVAVAHRYLPAGGAAGVGGDWFDVIPLSGARVALVVGDVVGHGINAAATMGRLRTAVHTLADLDLEPDEVLSHLDDLVTRLAVEHEAWDQGVASEQVVGATCLYAVYNPVSKLCTLARAGHPPPVVLTPDGQASLPELPAGPPLGLGGLPFESVDLELPENSTLALYTNGLIDGPRHDVDDGLTRLCDALSGPPGPLDETCQTIVDSLLPVRPADDVALLLARTRTLDPSRVATWVLPAEPTAPAKARGLTERQLVEWGLEELIFTTELIVSELVTNAYRYAGDPVTLRLIHLHRLICEVSDPSSTSPHLRRARSTDEGGRGLMLIAQLTARWGTRHAREGKTVWTEQELPSRTGSGALF
ncbi:SpoIIE family protein phosphatase [Streptomyces sp. NPDC059828]|uniref:SpoIIE family protein phosphatase n=1 Tax=Streptomyces sp. NPDC059828 TaxID=3346965 RepID=UPI00365F181D